MSESELGGAGTTGATATGATATGATATGATATGATATGALDGLPVWHPPRRVLELAELAVDGVLPGAPEVRLPAETLAADLATVVEDAGGLVLEDAEGTPVAVLRDVDLRRAGDGGVRLQARVEAVRPFAHGPVRAARRPAAAVRADLAAVAAGRGAVAVTVSAALPAAWPAAVTRAAAEAGAGAVLILVLVGEGRRRDLPPGPLLRAARGAAADLPVPSVVVPVALPEGVSAVGVAEALGAPELLAGLPVASGLGPAAGADLHPASAAEVRRALPAPERRGVTVFFTGLSGSGKSTVAKALADVVETAGRNVSLLDGDEVRRLLSAGLGFSRADRDLNIRRIGFVAAEVVRHGGVAICAPIAPFAQARDAVRAMVEEAGGDLVLIHVSTPLAECERRDRKGLYARARQGLVPDFTGISSPYEVPQDADLRLDTTDVEVEEAVAAVVGLLGERGYLPPSAVAAGYMERPGT